MRFLKYFNPYLLILIFLEIALFVANFQSGTYLVGWDNVMPELNLNLNVQRSLSSLWQEYRGLGLMDGMAHSANLFHTFSIYLLSFVFPEESLRYIFIHLTHLGGGIGFFFFARYLTKKSSVAFLGSLFYMLNIGIIQMYYAPLEVFAVHFAALPWLALTLTKALQKPTTTHLFLLFLAALLTTPQGFVPTVFIAFSVMAGFILLFHYLRTKDIRTVLLGGFMLFLANAFWALPYGASALQTPEVIQSTRINQYASEEIYYRNQAHGDLLNVLGLNGFMLSTIEYDHLEESDVFFMEAWRDHQSSPYYLAVYALCLLIIAIGIIGILKNKNHTMYPYLTTAALSFIFLANNTPVIEQINALIRTVFPLIGEAFRFPFTKFITVFVFCLSLFFCLGLASLLPRMRVANRILTPLLSLLLLMLALPAFQGHFTSPLLRLTIPQDYFELINHMKDEPKDRRIAVLPAHTFWNWHYRTWGHRGSGFLWHGIEQPMLERAFDPWSLYNEQYYNELSHALHNKDAELLENVTRKYDIGYFLLDQYVVNTLSTQPINYDSLTRFLDKQDYLSKGQPFGRLVLYKVENSQGFMTTITNEDENVSQAMFTRSDRAFAQEGNYISNPTQPYTTYFPFSSLFTEKLPSDKVFSVEEDASSITITPTLTEPITLEEGAMLTMPSLYVNEYLIPISIAVEENTLVFTPLYPELSINGKEIKHSVKPVTIAYQGEIPTRLIFNDIDHTVDLTKEARSYLLVNYPNTITLEGATDSTQILFDTSSLSSDAVAIALPTNKISSLKATFAKIPSPLAFNNILTSDAYSVQKNVEQLHPFFKEEGDATVQKSQNGIRLSAQSSSVQLVFYRDNLFHRASYLMLAETEYVSGLPINFYIDNPFEKRAEMEAVLAKENTVNALIIPQTQEFFKGYGFHFTVKSVGTEEAESLIKSISLYPFPKDTLENITLSTDPISTISAQENQGVHSLPYTHPHPGFYSLSFPRQKNTVLILSQSYDKGWKAYSIDNADNMVKRAFPFLFGKEIEEHVKVNNWKNGWVLNDQQMTSNSDIIIVYLPQYLHYLGFLLPFLVLIIFLAKKGLYSLRRHT